MADRRPLMNEDATADPPSETSNTPALPSLGFSTASSSLGFIPLAVSPPLSPRRPGYMRLGSDATAVERSPPPPLVEEEGEDEDVAYSLNQQSTSGLGIANATSQPRAISRRVSTQTIPRRPVPSSTRSVSIRSPDVSGPNTGESFGGFQQRSAESTPDLRRERLSPKTDAGDYESYRRGGLKHVGGSNTSLNDDYQHFLQQASKSSAPSLKSAYQSKSGAAQCCCLTKWYSKLPTCTRMCDRKAILSFAIHLGIFFDCHDMSLFHCLFWYLLRPRTESPSIWTVHFKSRLIQTIRCNLAHHCDG